MAKESTLTAIKGGTWSDETLVAIQAAIPAAAPTVEEIRTELEGVGTHLTLIKAATDNLPTDPAGVSDLPSEPPSAADIAGAVLDEPFMDHADPATIGGKIGLIPLEEPIPPSAEETAEEVWAYESATNLAAAVASIQAALAGSTVVGASPIDDAGDITIYQGWDYDSDIGTAIEIAFPVATYGDLTTATVALKLSVGTTYAGTVVNGGTASQLVRWEFTAAQTAAMTAIHDAYVVVVTSGGLVYDIGRGSWEVRSRYEG
jgi:hypothetical protein